MMSDANSKCLFMVSMAIAMQSSRFNFSANVTPHTIAYTSADSTRPDRSD